MDDADITERNREFLEREAHHKSHKFTPDATATGFCLFCGEPLTESRRWCDVTCRDDWEIENQ